jgi:hypothetical protein
MESSGSQCCFRESRIQPESSTFFCEEESVLRARAKVLSTWRDTINKPSLELRVYVLSAGLDSLGNKFIESAA